MVSDTAKFVKIFTTMREPDIDHDPGRHHVADFSEAPLRISIEGRTRELHSQ